MLNFLLILLFTKKPNDLVIIVLTFDVQNCRKTPMINKLLKPIARFLPENNRYERIWKLAQVDFKKRYYNDKLGLVWALLNPLFKIAIYYVVFTFVLERGKDNFVIFLFAGLLVFMTFSEAATKGMNLLQSKKYLLENIQFNKIDLFISSTASVFLGFAFNLIAYIIFLVSAGISLNWNLLYFPLLLLNIFILCMGTSLILSTIKIFIKDITHVWAIISIATFWSSGVFFSADQLLSKFPFAIYINPLIGIIHNVREISMFGSSPNIEYLLLSYTISIIVYIIGYIIFKKFSHKAIELM